MICMEVESKGIKDTKCSRIDWVDIAKGLAIIFTIIGHTIIVKGIFENGIRGAIYSFHMPLFFSLAGVTFKTSSTVKQCLYKMWKSFKQLIIPAVLVFIVRSVLIHGLIPVKSILKSIFWASGVDGNGFAAVGMVWFLFVMFEVRLLYDIVCFIVKNHRYIVVFGLTFLGILLGKICWLPQSLDVAFAVMMFFVGGAVASLYS